MKEYPIIFNTDMVKAILEGRKTQTRRVIKPQPENELTMYSLNGAINWRDENLNLDEEPYGNYSGCPYGQVGDRLWVRETWAMGFTSQRPDSVIYKADDTPLPTSLERGTYTAKAGWGKWAPSIFMERGDSRITLEITEVRVERVQEISLKDAIEEGVTKPVDVFHSTIFITNFMVLWDSLNAKRGYGWESNPWVFVISFKVIDK